MTSQNVVERDVLSFLSTKGKVGGKNPISHICANIDMNRREDKEVVESAVRRLERDGKITVEQNSNGRIRAIYHRRPKRNVDRTEWSAEAKREHMFAKGVPAYLPNELCSPVKVTWKKDIPASEPAEAPVTGEDMPQNQGSSSRQESYAINGNMARHEVLTVALRVLREMADDTGLGYHLSVRNTLKTFLPSLTPSQINRVLEQLRAMKLYSATSGGKHSSYQLNLSVTEVTEAMVEELLRSTRKIVPATGSESPEASEPVGDTQPFDELASIIERQDAQLEMLRREMADMRSSLEEAGNQLEQARTERAQLLEENGVLQRRVKELEAHRPELSPRVQAILQRHRK